MEIFTFILAFVGAILFYNINKRFVYLTAITNDLRARIKFLESKLDSRANASTFTPSVAVEVPKIEKKESSIVENPFPQKAESDFEKPVDPVIQLSTPVDGPQRETGRQLKTPPNSLGPLIAKIQNYFMTGNTLVKVGVILIFFGISFLLKYAIDNNILPIEVRLSGSALLGIVLVYLGWNLRIKSRDYGLVLQGGGIGVLILTTFIAFKMYHLIPSEMAFTLLVCFTAATSFLAIKQDSMNLAAFGLTGGFLAPILASSGQGQHVVLFSYYTLLNLAIVIISWKKAWRELNLLGFVFTFGISSTWGVLKYSPEFYATTQPFLIFFFLIYVAIPLMFAEKKEPELKGYVDGTLVFGNSIITILLQLKLIEGVEYGGAFSALILAAFYIFLSRYLFKHKKENYRLLAEAFISIGVVFTTIAIPLAFDGLKTSAIWALEAAGIYWIALKQKRNLARYFSTFLIFATSLSFFLGPKRGMSDLILLNTFFFSCIFMAVGSYIISFLNDKYADLLSKEEQIVANLTLWMGTAWWFFGGITELERYRSSWTGGSDPAIVTSVIPKAYLLNIEIGYFSLMTFIFYFVAQKYSWDKFKSFAYGLIPVLFISFLMKLDEKINPFAYGGYAAWALAFAVIYYILYFNDQISKLSAKWNLKLAHVGALVTLVGVFVSEIKWWAELYVPESTAWQKASMGIVPVFAIWSITQNKMVPNWPVKRNYSLYLNFVLLPIVVSTWIWISITNWTNGGSSAPLPYLPLLNPLELSHLAALFAGTIWVMEVMKSGTLLKSIDKKRIGVVLGVTYFFWLNGVLCRAIHQYLGIPFDFSTMFSAVEVQVGLSIFWSVLGIAIMIFASKKLLRWLWITGASLLGLVVVKMFIIDLSKTETIGRVASFIIVGILFLIVGYFSPIPPRKTNNV